LWEMENRPALTYPLESHLGLWHGLRIMYLRPHRRSKDGKAHAYWSLVETVRTPDGPRKKTVCYLGKLNSSAHARWMKTVELFNEQGDAQQLKLFPSSVAAPENDPEVARVRQTAVRPSPKI